MSTSLSHSLFGNMTEGPQKTCPTCELPVTGDVSEDEIEVLYQKRGAPTSYSKGWYGCSKCLAGLIKTIEEYMEVQRVNRGISIRVNREQYRKQKDSGCGCGG